MGQFITLYKEITASCYLKKTVDALAITEDAYRMRTNFFTPELFKKEILQTLLFHT